MPEEDSAQRLLAFARKLQRASTFAELLDTAREEVLQATTFKHVWFMVADREQADELRLIEYSGERREFVWDVAPVLRVEGDPMLEELVTSDAPVVIHDARTDPRTNKAVVEQLQNRTIINIPLRLLDKPLGIFGLGTFGDEGCHMPDAPQLAYLVGMGSQLAVAAGRIRFLETKARAEREKRELEHRMMQIQKLESLGLLAGGIAHDFNNLLTVIISGVSLAIDQSLDAGVQEELQTVLDAAGRAGQLTKQLLVMSRSQELDLRSVDVNVRIEQLMALLRRVMPENIEIDLVKAPKLPAVDADATQLDQIFMNLCINSRDAMMGGGGRITIETEQVLINGGYAQAHPWAKKGRYVLVTVTDTGSGMPADVVERVFEPFFTTKGPQAGTGLGLAVAYGIVRQHGGMMHCYSEVGVGTSFKVYLPAREQFASDVGSKLHGIAPSGTERILLAEDDAGVRAVAVRILTKAGYDVTAVENGDAACRTVAKDDFALVILDVVMPGMACAEVVARIHALKPAQRMLLASGYTGGAQILDSTRNTPLELLMKPYDPDRLLRGVRNMLDRGKL
ncbi:MAG TPA: ATP-binding protein [Polyangiaceae bacterium]|jgi:signal transduction histidine kinase|nr:ATP-binding protein [Polyangiaceae bacterium]